MYDTDGNKVLCGANHYTQKYYFNEDFSMLPEEIKRDLQALCVLYVEEVGGILLMEFDKEGNLLLRVESEEGDGFFDEIGSALKVKQIQRDRRPFLESLELFYRTFYLAEPEKL
ncbi:MAG: hypothetical protein HFI63_10655 [Lachnospiraceae bacterium]|nr:hypothetical protein [Lachnospiraceae bacterium]